MIRYSLVCDREHVFDSWFRDSGAFDSLSASKQVACPSCGSVGVRKAMMTPSVVTGRAKAAEGKSVESEAPSLPAAAPAAVSRPVVLMDERAQQLRAMIRELHQRVAENADDVGRRFAAEARAIHEGDSPARSIYGEATRDEVSALLDDGIPLMPLPPLPDDHH